MTRMCECDLNLGVICGSVIKTSHAALVTSTQKQIMSRRQRF